MDRFNQTLESIRKGFFNSILPYTDSSYYILRHKVDPD